jgi:hypothetical protein
MKAWGRNEGRWMEAAGTTVRHTTHETKETMSIGLQRRSDRYWKDSTPFPPPLVRKAGRSQLYRGGSFALHSPPTLTGTAAPTPPNRE